MITIEELAAAQRPYLRTDRDYPEAMSVPIQHGHRIPLSEIPKDIAARLRDGAPRVTDAAVTMFVRKGEEFLQFAAGSGSRDGFPLVIVPVPTLRR